MTDKPRIKSDILPNLLNLPPNSLGHNYASFMKRNKISPDSRTEVRFVDDTELAYVMTRYRETIPKYFCGLDVTIFYVKRYRETHDLTHCILGQETSLVGEVLVKWVEAVQFRLPMAVGGAIFGPLRFKPNQREAYHQLLPWAIQQGTEAKFLLNIYYEQRWEQDLEDFRKEFNISPPSQ